MLLGLSHYALSSRQMSIAIDYHYYVNSGSSKPYLGHTTTYNQIRGVTSIYAPTPCEQLKSGKKIAFITEFTRP